MYLFATAVIDVSISLYCLFDDPTEVASWCRDPEQRRRQEAGDGAGRCSFFSVGDRAQVAEIRIRDDNTKEAEQEDARFFSARAEGSSAGLLARNSHGSGDRLEIQCLIVIC
jgi:hypothetical protein